MTYNRRNVVTTLAPSFLYRSLSFLQVSGTCIKACMNLNFSHIPLLTTESAAFVRLKDIIFPGFSFIFIQLAA